MFAALVWQYEKAIRRLLRWRPRKGMIRVMSEQTPEGAGSAVRVGASLTKVTGNDGDAEAAKRAGYVRIQENELRDLATIGAHVQGARAVQICRGKAIVHQQQINCMIHALSRTILDLEEKPKKTKSDLNAMAQLSRSLAYLSAQLTGSQRLLLEMEDLSLTGDSNSQEPLVQSFAPGAIVVPRPDHCPTHQLPTRNGG
jgi:hypothetical protein